MWFFRRIKQKGTSQNDMQDKAAVKIARILVKTQSRFASVMGRLSSRISTQKLKVIVILFSFLGAGFSLYCIAKAILPDQNVSPFRAEHTSVPKLPEMDNQESNTNVLISDETLQTINAFKEYMDSLRLNGSKIYDSIISNRPHLMDSINMLEEMYYSQQLK